MSKPTILVIVGITGDLSRRKLLPAIERIADAGAVPKNFKVIGVTRQDLKITDLLKQPNEKLDYLQKHSELFKMDLGDPADYTRLKDHLKAIEAKWGEDAQHLFYLSVPPQVSRPIVELLGANGLATTRTKLLLEKPFGSDLASAEELVAETSRHFKEEQLYRIDHYLAKEMAQNFIIFRRGNSLFKRTWNKDFIERIEITASEKIGIEGRAEFYEQTGALRDLVQSHLLQLAALALMPTPSDPKFKDVPALRAEALRQLHVATDIVGHHATRGQYEGYREEVKNPNSWVETYVDITLESQDPRWRGVPVRIITGKSLATKETSIRIVYRKEEAFESNELVIRMQPDEGVEVKLWTKVPGYEWRVEKHRLHLDFKDHFPDLPEAYERVLLDAINSDHTLFTSSDEVLESWRIIEPVLKTWEFTDDGLKLYDPGAVPGSL